MSTFIDKVERAKVLIGENTQRYPNCAVAISFGKDSIVLLDLVMKVDPSVPVFAVLADTEFQETLEFRDQVLAYYTLDYLEYNFVNDPSKGLGDCCRSMKVEAFKNAVKDLDCWFSGIRRDEGITRADFQPVEEREGLVKVNPILDFTEKDVWRYTALYGLPVNSLYTMGYRSLSCRLCSAKEDDESESEREGRWKGTEHWGGECGIHTQPLKVGPRVEQSA